MGRKKTDRVKWNLYLSPEEHAKLEVIREYHGLSTRATTIREIIRKEFDRVAEQVMLLTGKAPVLKVPPATATPRATDEHAERKQRTTTQPRRGQKGHEK